MPRLLSDKETDTLWSMCDSDGDGKIDSDEFEHLLRFRLKVPCLETCRTCDTITMDLQLIKHARLCVVCLTQKTVCELVSDDIVIEVTCNSNRRLYSVLNSTFTSLECMVCGND